MNNKLRIASIVLVAMLLLGIVGYAATSSRNNNAQNVNPNNNNSVSTNDNNSANNNNTNANTNTNDNLLTKPNDENDNKSNASDNANNTNNQNTTQSQSTASNQTSTSNTSSQARVPKAPTIDIYDKNDTSAERFEVKNMFPGDLVSQTYRVKVSHEGAIDLYFKTTLQPGSEKLGEVLKCKVSVPSEGSVIYDGLLKDLTNPITYNLGSSVSEVDYIIDVYLETSVGNEYMQKTLIADFIWYVEDTSQLAPQTSDNIGGLVFAIIALVVAFGAIVILWRKKQNGKGNKN